MNEESHPWMKSFTYLTALDGIAIVALSVVIFVVTTPKNVVGLGIVVSFPIALGLILFWAARRLLRVSDKFRRWNTLSNKEKAIGIFIMYPGICTGFFFWYALFIIYFAIKPQGRK